MIDHGEAVASPFSFCCQAMHFLLRIEPLFVFGLAYVAILAAAVAINPAPAPGLFHQSGVIAAAIATVLAIRRERILAKDLGWLGTRLTTFGFLAGAAVPSATHLVLLASGSTTHTWQGSVPWWAVTTLMLPAAVHEELLFRGVAFGALARVSPPGALIVTSLLFSLLHSFNPGVGPIALLNVALAGVMLGVIRMRWGLWSAVAAHFTWNVMSGVVMGYPVSGWIGSGSLFSSETAGPSWWTGAGFGMEGGAAMTISIVAGLAVLTVLHNRGRDRMSALSRGSVEPIISQETHLR